MASLTSWIAFFTFRKSHIETNGLHTIQQLTGDQNFWIGIAIIPLCWLLLYQVMGSYRCVLRKARLPELGQTLLATLIGVIVIFFAFMLDDAVSVYTDYYFDFVFLFVTHFLITYLPRLCLTTHTVRKIHQKKIGFNTLMIGCGSTALDTYRDLQHQEVYSGNKFVGFLNISEKEPEPNLIQIMPQLGTLKDIRNVIQQHHIEEVIIALDTPQQPQAGRVLQQLGSLPDIIIKITPNCRNMAVGRMQVNNLFHSPLLVIDNRLMPEWQYSVKRLFDIVVSILVMIVLSPIYLITAVAVKCSSPGPVFYTQERIGRGGKPFRMHKFRSMYIDAEASGPALSKDYDPRITPFGLFMRKVRLDEIPQFYNVLKGTMSLVGPRPERQHYIDQIVQVAPEYQLLQRIKPGITSWGQVKYGYASNVDQMVERLRYDLLYLDNMSLTTDIKILLYTVIIIIEGRGK
ncbi:MAG: sugar transferase [Bacteroidales bacterium]|nr:sugar transferase [Candidatus Colimorpha onthohippi]